MSWIGRKIYEYLKECEEFKKEMNAGYQPNDRLDTSNPPTNELPNFKFIPPEPIFPSDEYIDERKIAPEPPSVDELRSKTKGCVPRTECLQPAPKKHTTKANGDSGIFVLFDEKGIEHIIDLPAPKREPFENFKNNRKKMKKEVLHCERYILTSVKEDGKVSITIEPKKGLDVCNVSQNVVTGELPKEHVLPKELLNPRPELQDQYDTLAKLISTMDYYNGQKTFMGYDLVVTINVHGMLDTERYGLTNRKLYFINYLIAGKFLANFRSEIESVKHII